MSIEQQIVSTLGKNPELISLLDVGPNDFTDGRVARIMMTVTDLIRDGKEPDPILIAETMNFNSSENWAPDVFACWEEVSIPKNFDAYQRVVKETKKQRLLKQTAHEFVTDLNAKNPEAVHKVLDNVRNIESSGGEIIQTLDSFVPKVAKHLDDVENGLKKPGLTTGLRDLDTMIGGLNRGDQVIVAARTNVGKTAMMVNLAVNCDAPCLIISGEQGGEQITQRVIAKLGGISAFRLRMGNIRHDEHIKLAQVAKEIKENQKIFIVDKSRPSIDDIEQLARAAKWKYNIECLFVDYLQLINHPSEKDKRLQIVDISKRGKELAKELDIPVVMLAQLNRNAEGRRPQISDLKESGSIEEDADAVILLYPAENEGVQVKGELTVDLQKHRHGPKGFFNVHWNPEFMRAEDL